MNRQTAIHAAATDEAGYFRERARDERRRIAHAATDRARRTHIELADHYDAVAQLLEARPTAESFTVAYALRRMLNRLSGS